MTPQRHRSGRVVCAAFMAAADGRSEDEVIAAGPTSDLDAVWGEDSERFVRAVYISVTGESE